MLTIKDLTVSKELDRDAMEAVRGCGDIFSSNTQSQAQLSTGGLVSVNSGTQNLLSSNTAFDYTDVQKTFVGIGSFGAAFSL